MSQFIIIFIVTWIEDIYFTNLITLRERKSRYIIAIKNQSKEACGTALALISTITKIKNHIKSITFDQGSEFKKYE